jgi:hypothetical protein
MTKVRLPARKRVILPLPALALLGAAPALAAPAPTRTATVELVEVDGKGAQTPLRFTLALDPSRPSELDAASRGSSYRIKVRCDKDGRHPLVHLQLTQHRQSKERGETVKLSVSARVAQGRRVVLSRIARPDGGTLVVALTVT